MTHFKGVRYGVVSAETLPQVNILYYAIDHTLVDSTLTDFPIGIKIESDTNFMNDRISLDWQNLHVVDEGDNELYVEVEKWDHVNKEAIIWVKVSSVSSSIDTILTISMGSVNTTYVGEPGDTAAQSVWDDDFVAVWHMSQDPTGGSGCIIDSTGNGHNGTPDGSMTADDLVDGAFSKALDFDGINDVVDVSAIGSSLSAWTITALATTDTLASEKMIFTNDLSGWNDDVLLGIDPETGLDDGYIGVIHQDSTNSVRTQINSAVALAADGTEYAISAWANGSTLYLKVNNETTVSLSKQGAALDFGNNVLQIGFSDNGTREWDGLIGEVRLSQISRGEAWVKAEQYNLLGTLVSRAAIYAGNAPSYLGFADIIGAYKEFVPVGISEEIGFTGEAIEDNFKFDFHWFGTLREGYDDNDSQYGTPTLSDYWVSFTGSNEGLWWDQDLDTSDFELHAIFRIDETALSSIPNTHEIVWKSGNGADGVSLSYIKRGNGQHMLVYAGTVSSALTYIEINLKNLSFSTGVWYEVFATATKLVFREYGNESNSVTISGTCNVGYADYYQSVGVSIGACPVLSSTSGYSKCSIRDLDFYHAGKMDMPVDVNLYPVAFWVKFGNNYDGNGGITGSSGSPTVNDDWITYDGNDASYFSTSAPYEDISDLDFYIVFRLEEDHLDVLKGYYTIWSIGDATDGFELAIYDRQFAFISRNNTTLQENIVNVYNLELDVWYEAFLSTSKITIREQATPANGFTQYGTVDVNANYTSGYHAIGSGVGAYIWKGGSGTWADYTQVSFKELKYIKQGGLTFPSDLSTPAVGPIFRWNWGTDVGGTYSWSGSTYATNTDNVENNGSTAGIYDNIDGNYETPSTGWGLVVEFDLDSLSGPQVIWKTGDENNGLAIGIDSSGNFGLFGRSSGSLTSITFSASTYMSTSTKYLVYATLAKVMLVDEYGSLVQEATGTVTMTDSTGGQDHQSILVAVYGSPISGNSSTWSDYLDGRVYSHEIWEYDDFSFPETNWYESESELGLADTIDGEITSAVVGISETIGFNDSIDGLNVANTFYTEDTIGFNDAIDGEQVATQKAAPSTLGLDDTISADHIDETTGEVAEDIYFNDVIDGYNSYSHKEAASTLGFNDEVGGHMEIKTTGISEEIGFNDTIDGYNSHIYREVQSTIGFNDEVGGKNIITREGNDEEIGFNDSINANITEIEGFASEIGFNDFVFGNRTIRNIGISEDIAFNDEIGGGDPFQPDESSEIGFTGTAEVSYHPLEHLSENIWFHDIIGVVRNYEVGIEETIGFNDSPFAENAGNLIPVIPSDMKFKFYLTLTGANDSLDDFEITELKTVQFRMKNEDESSYLGISARYTEEKETEIDARPNGTLVLEMASYLGGVEILRAELLEVNFSDVRYDIGSNSRSITINGYSALTYSHDIAYLTNAIFKRVNQDGRISYRFARPDFYVRPGWECVYGVEKFTVDEVAFYVGDLSFEMDVYFEPETLIGENDNDIYRRLTFPAYRKRKLFVTLTGSEDAVDDYSFENVFHLEVRKKAGAASYASVTLLFSKETKEAIEARPNGDIVIYVQDGIDAPVEEFITVNFNNLSHQLLQKSRTITIAGFRQTAYPTGVSFTPENVIEERVEENGDYYVKSMTPDVNIEPGCTVTYNSKTFMAGKVSFNFASQSEWMELSNTANIDVDRYSEEEIAIGDEVVSNTFYRDNNSESELGLLGEHHASLNGVENAYHDTSDIGFTAYIGYELNP